MEQSVKGRSSRNLIAAMIAVVILAVVAGLYLDRQGERTLIRYRTEVSGNILEHWGTDQVRSVLGAQPAAFAQVSYKNIISRVAPSVVSVNVEASGFIDSPTQVQPLGFPRGSGLNPWCPPGGAAQQMAYPRGGGLNPWCPPAGAGGMQQMGGAQNQPADQSGVSGSAQYVWGGRMGGWGMGPVGNLICPNCSTTVPHQRGVPAYTVGCPNCGTPMVRQGAPGFCPVPPVTTQQLANQDQQTQGQTRNPAGGQTGDWGAGWGRYMLCPNCCTTMPCLTGVPPAAVGCPCCGMQMQTVQGWSSWGYPMASPPAAQWQQPADQQDNFQFQGPSRGGSGVIVNSGGYVLTNHHVVHGAKSITVTLSSGKITKTYPAQLIDEAAEFDFAMLKIQSSGGERFAPAPIGNSSEVSVGDEVLAIGSPFGLQQTVTFGIISNTARTLTVGKTKFTDFFQTDAPINPGSSGGPLVNVNGEVIGLNTAIYSPTQAFSGIGFASPIDPAKAAFAEFIEVSPDNAARTLVRNAPSWMRRQLTPVAAQAAPPSRLRGQGLFPFCPQGAGRWRQAGNAQDQNLPVYLGICAAPVDSGTRSIFDLPATMGKGVLAMEVFDNSAAFSAGLQSGDVILRLDGRSVKDMAMFERILSQKRPTDEMRLTVYREGKRINVDVRLPGGPAPAFGGFGPEGEWIDPRAMAAIPGQAVALTSPKTPLDPTNAAPPGLTGVLAGAEVEAGGIEALGMGVEDLAPELALAFNIPKGLKGVIVTESENQAQAAGIIAGDVIRAVDNRRVKSVADFIKIMQKASLKKGIALDIYRQGQRFQVIMKG